MAYRNDTEALLARLQAMTTELAAAKEEIRILEGGSDESASQANADVSEVTRNLKSARSRLAGLIGGKRKSSSGAKSAPHQGDRAANEARIKRDNDVACAALAHGLRAVLVAKIGHVPELLEVALESLPPLAHLISALVFAAEHDERLELTSGVARALTAGRLR